MLQRPIITDWSAGELSDLMSGRIELDLYNKGCSTLENWQVLSQGCITTRPGSKYVATTKAAARIIPMILDSTTAYLLEFGVNYLRIYDSSDQLITFTYGGQAVSEIPTAYASIAHIRQIQIAQDGNTLYLAHSSYRPTFLKIDTSSGIVLTFGAMTITGNENKLPFQPIAAGNDAGNWPGSVAIFGGRLWFGGSPKEPQTVWASKTFDYTNFTYYDTVSVTTQQMKPVAEWADPDKPEYKDVTVVKDITSDASAMKFTLGSDQLERIQWMASGRDLIIGGSTSEFIVPAGVTALSPGAIQQTRHGSARLQGLMFKDSVVFVQSGGKRVLDYQWSNEGGSYFAPNLTHHADAVLGTGVIDFDFTQTPQPMLLCVRADGQLAVLVYDKQYGVMAWCRYVTSGTYESVAVSVDANGDDVVYVVVNRAGGRYIEKFDFARSSYQLDCYNTAVAGATISASRFTNGTVVKVKEGNSVFSATVADGSIARPTGVTPNASVQIGLSYTCTMKTSRVATKSNIGPGQGTLKRVVAAIMNVFSSFAPKVQYSSSANAEQAVFTTTPFTGLVRVPYNGDWDMDGYVTVVQSEPLPVTILSLSPEVDAT